MEVTELALAKEDRNSPAAQQAVQTPPLGLPCREEITDLLQHSPQEVRPAVVKVEPPIPLGPVAVAAADISAAVPALMVLRTWPEPAAAEAAT